jgi:RNase P subunit RPR2
MNQQKLATTYHCPQCFEPLLEVDTGEARLHANLVCTDCLVITCHHNAFTKQQVRTAKRLHEQAQRN